MFFFKWETKILGKSFSLNPEWNKQKENECLLTIVFLFHAIIGETQSKVFYVTHALPFKIRTNSIFILFDLTLFEDPKIRVVKMVYSWIKQNEKKHE